MLRRYFDMDDDVYIPGRWHVGGPVDPHGNDIMPWRLRKEGALDLGGEPVTPLVRPGRGLDFSLTEITSCVVSQRFVSLCEKLGVQDQAQFIRTRVEEHSEPYFILHPLRIIRCIDEARCEEVRHWEPHHGVPEKVGQYRNVVGLRIDTTQVGAAEIFRPWGWTVVLIVSERLKLAIEDAKLTGPKFVEV